MNFTIIEAKYAIGGETVVIVTQNPLGGLTNVETTQADLDAARGDASAPWGDEELRTVATEKLPAMFPGVAGLTVSLNEPDA